jgi:ribosomal protein S18 acetylase RimI-like enzyme
MGARVVVARTGLSAPSSSPSRYGCPVTRRFAIDAATMTAIERHELLAHAIPSRETRDLGDALLLHDRRDSEPFWNRLQAVRWPVDAAAFDHRLAETLVLFAVLGRRPHVWPSPVHAGPPDLALRLQGNGFVDIGGGHLMVMADRDAAPAVRPGEAPEGVTLHPIAQPQDARTGDLDDAGLVLAASFGAPLSRASELATDLERTLPDARVVLVLVRVDGVAAAVAKATTFGGWTYLSSVGTLPGYRGRGLAALATRQAIASAAAVEQGRPYLGVFSGNDAAIRLYERLGFCSVGESPDLLLETPGPTMSGATIDALTSEPA